jgi:hypothetical protein
MPLTAGTWRISESTLIGGQQIDEVSTTARHPLGLIVRASDSGTTNYGSAEFIYLKGVASGAKGSWVTYNMDDGTTTLLAANAKGPVGIMMAALDAATDFGWVQISGKAIGKCLANYADNADVYATATAGSVDDTLVAGDLVLNAKGASAVDTGEAEFEISRPFVTDILPPAP